MKCRREFSLMKAPKSNSSRNTVSSSNTDLWTLAETQGKFPSYRVSLLSSFSCREFCVCGACCLQSLASAWEPKEWRCAVLEILRYCEILLDVHSKRDAMSDILLWSERQAVFGPVLRSMAGNRGRFHEWYFTVNWVAFADEDWWVALTTCNCDPGSKYFSILTSTLLFSFVFCFLLPSLSSFASASSSDVCHRGVQPEGGHRVPVEKL